MKGSAIRCAGDRHKWKHEYGWGGPKKCSRCGLRLQCFRGKHRYGFKVERYAECSECGKRVARRARTGELTMQPH